MILAKIKNTQVLKYPYGWQNLLEDNPNTQFDDRFDLESWFAQTESALNGEQLVEVVVVRTVAPNNVDLTTHKATMMDIPAYSSEHGWYIDWVISELTSEEAALVNSGTSVPT